MSETEQNATPNTTTKKARWTPPKPTQAQLDALEEKHEDILRLDGTEMAPWCIVLRRPTRQETIMYKQHQRKEGQNATANDAFIRRLAVFPEMADLDLILSKWSMAPDFIVDNSTFHNFLGVTSADQLKK